MSVFTFDPDPPRVASPWPWPAVTAEQDILAAGSQRPNFAESYGVTRLPPEPQDGPVEYKLHLLLRPRRPYRSLSTTSGGGDTQFPQRTRIVASSTAGQTRQDRCQHLTTQLLWRLRQSSPYHASVAHGDVVVPQLPEDAVISSSLPVTLGKLAPGLEESHGALYEIGVADDGTLAGITMEELDQSIATLRWMAASLGCVSEVQRMVVVGECEWMDEGPPQKGMHHGTPSRATNVSKDSSFTEKTPYTHRASLWVAEVFIRPHLHGTDAGSAEAAPTDKDGVPLPRTPATKALSTTLGASTADQLRVTLTGPTGSGKSTLLGTLSTGAFDDGHGKSRLHSLKHRHEMDSGLTSTVTQELVGYTGNAIVNYANPNIESWIGIHDYTKNGRLVFISDSAGHPRFRRTTLRGLVGWAPHWTLLCLDAATDHAESSPAGLLAGGSVGSSSGGSFGGHSYGASDLAAGVGSAALAKAHLDLCLDLDLPLVVLITKSDLLTKESLKRSLTPIWTAVKKAGRTPHLLQSKQKAPEDAQSLSPDDIQAIDRVLAHASDAGNTARTTVPVVLTSAVSGDGIGLVHALLRGLPRPPTPTAGDYVGMALNPEQPEALFHIGDRFSRPASYAAAGLGQMADPGHVVSGYLRFGGLSVGDRVVMGPFPADPADAADAVETADNDIPAGDTSEGDHAVAGTRSLSSPSEQARVSAAKRAVPSSSVWYDARIVSIRNLRLPVQTLAADQVGTIGLVVEAPTTGQLSADDPPSSLPPQRKPRRGMVLAAPGRHMVDSGLRLQAASGLTAFFGNAGIGLLAAGTPVTFYVASVRAQARIAKIWSVSAGGDDDDNDDDAEEQQQGYNVQLELLLGREWIELGGKIVLLEGAASQEGFLLDGFIGKVVEIVD